MKKTILVIDDDVIMRFLLQKMLEKEYNVVTKDDGLDALNWLNSGNIPDLILVDMEMPNLNGNAFIRRVRFSTTLRKIPIIIVSGNDNQATIQSFLKLGANDYLLKPFKEDDFWEKIYRIVEFNE
jgi:CheY-like chemotaxis protein